MLRGWTTRCCSAFALVVLATTAIATQSSPLSRPRVLPVTDGWKLSLNNPLTAPPALQGARGYFPVDSDRLLAYDIEHGTLLWVAPVRTSWQPAIGGRLIFVVDHDAIAALRDDTGTIAWQLPFAEPMAAPLVWDNGWLIATTESGDVLAFRAVDGTLLWRQSLGAKVHAKASLAADRVYLPLEDRRVLALQVETGAIRWERRLGGEPNEILALDDRLFLGSNDDSFYAIDSGNGRVLWTWPTGADVVGAPVADDRRVYFVAYDNVLRALDRQTGNQRWKRPLPIRPTRAPVAVDGVLLVTGLAPTSYGYSMRDGSAADNVSQDEGELAAPPHVIADAAPPLVVLVIRNLEHRTVVRAFQRRIEAGESDMKPLPNPTIPAAPIEPPPTPPTATEPPAPQIGDRE